MRGRYALTSGPKGSVPDLDASKRFHRLLLLSPLFSSPSSSVALSAPSRVGFLSMASPYSFVTLLTSDSYLPGALTLAAALRDVHPSPPSSPEVAFQTVCLVTPETLDVASIKLLRRAYDLVVGVEIIEEDNARGLQLLGTSARNLVSKAIWRVEYCSPAVPQVSRIGVCALLRSLNLQLECLKVADHTSHRMLSRVLSLKLVPDHILLSLF